MNLCDEESQRFFISLRVTYQTGSGLMRLFMRLDPSMWVEVQERIISIGWNLFPLLRVIRAPSGIGTLRSITSTSPVPFTIITEENIHAQAFSDP
jgi:hypothetical protein